MLLLDLTQLPGDLLALADCAVVCTLDLLLFLSQTLHITVINGLQLFPELIHLFLQIGQQLCLRNGIAQIFQEFIA